MAGRIIEISINDFASNDFNRRPSKSRIGRKGISKGSSDFPSIWESVDRVELDPSRGKYNVLYGFNVRGLRNVSCTHLRRQQEIVDLYAGVQSRLHSARFNLAAPVVQSTRMDIMSRMSGWKWDERFQFSISSNKFITRVEFFFGNTDFGCLIFYTDGLHGSFRILLCFVEWIKEGSQSPWNLIERWQDVKFNKIASLARCSIDGLTKMDNVKDECFFFFFFVVIYIYILRSREEERGEKEKFHSIGQVRNTG